MSPRRRNREDSVKIEADRWAYRGAPDARAVEICPMRHLPDAAYSGIGRMLDLALSGERGIARGLYLVEPDSREEEVRAQPRRYDEEPAVA